MTRFGRVRELCTKWEGTRFNDITQASAPDPCDGLSERPAGCRPHPARSATDSAPGDSDADPANDSAHYQAEQSVREYPAIHADDSCSAVGAGECPGNTTNAATREPGYPASAV